jgi:hypothetical protein
MLKGVRQKTVIDREQYVLTPMYAFTDYKAQGQNMESVIMDLAKLPLGTLTGFNAYIALSHGRGHSTICPLQNFEEKLFTTHPSEFLRKEDEQLAVNDTGLPVRTRGVENEPKKSQIGPEMKEIWSVYCFDHISTPWVRMGKPVSFTDNWMTLCIQRWPGTTWVNSPGPKPFIQFVKGIPLFS